MFMQKRTGKWADVYTWMKDRVLAGDFIDCDEVQLTLLGEAAISDFKLTDDDQDDVDDLAYEVSEWYEHSRWV